MGVMCIQNLDYIMYIAPLQSDIVSNQFVLYHDLIITIFYKRREKKREERQGLFIAVHWNNVYMKSA